MGGRRDQKLLPSREITNDIIPYQLSRESPERLRVPRDMAFYIYYLLSPEAR